MTRNDDWSLCQVCTRRNKNCKNFANCYCGMRSKRLCPSTVSSAAVACYHKWIYFNNQVGLYKFKNQDLFCNLPYFRLKKIFFIISHCLRQLLSTSFRRKKLLIQQLVIQKQLSLIFIHSCRFFKYYIKGNPHNIIKKIKQNSNYQYFSIGTEEKKIIKVVI